MGLVKDVALMPMVLLGAAVLAVEKSLMALVRVYDVVVYSPLQMALSPIVRRIPRHVTIRGQQVNVFTANTVSWSRTFLVIPIAVALKYGWPWLGFWLVMLHDFLDHLDGIVAKVQRLTHPGLDDPLLGGFMDAFCDKIVNVLALWSVLMVADFSTMTSWFGALYVTSCCVIIGYEFVLGVVRVQDFFQAFYVRELCGEKKEAGGSTASVMVGKLKEKLESLGIACLCLAQPQAWCPAGVIGVTCLLLSIRLAHASLTEKLNKRQPLPREANEKEVDEEVAGRQQQQQAGERQEEQQTVQEETAEVAEVVPGSEVEDEGPKVEVVPGSKVEDDEGPKVEATVERKPDHSDDEAPPSELPTVRYHTKSKEQIEREMLRKEGLLDDDGEILDTIYTEGRRRLSIPLTELDCRMDKAYTVGCFDLFHSGHIRLLRRMRAIAKQIVVGVHDSRSIYKLKKRVPIDSTEKRMRNVKQHADVVFCVAGTDPSTFIYCIFNAPQGNAVYIRGNDMVNFPAREVCEELMEVKFLPYTEGISSTKLRKELLNSSQAEPRIDRDDMHLFY